MTRPLKKPESSYTDQQYRNHSETQSLYMCSGCQVAADYRGLGFKIYCKDSERCGVGLYTLIIQDRRYNYQMGQKQYFLNDFMDVGSF